MDYQLNVFRVVKQLKSNAFVPLHTHDFYHYIIVISGTGLITCNGVSYEASAGELFMCKPGVYHSVAGINEFTSIDIKFECSGPLSEMIDLKQDMIPNLSEYELSLIKDIFGEAALGKCNFSNIINSLMLTFLMTIIRRAGSESDISNDHICFHTSSNKDLNAALSYIDSNITSTISISQLAKSIGYSPSYFSTIFKAYTGYIPCQYINLKRIDLAKKLILTSKMNITEISEYLGFDSLHYFSRTFKKCVGISPKSYYNRINNSAGITIVDGKSYFSTDKFVFALQHGDIGGARPAEGAQPGNDEHA